MRASRFALVLVAVLALALCAVAACFPGYTFGGSPDDGGAPGDDASAPADATLDATDGSTATDSPSTGDDAPADSPNDSLAPWDGGPFDATATAAIASGTYAFQASDNGNFYVDASVTLTYGYALDDYEVTVERFRGWVDAGLPLPADGASLDPDPNAFKSVMKWSASWNTLAQTATWDSASGCGSAVGGSVVKTYPIAGAQAARYPVSCVNWYSALAFCAWEGKRLPTESEWRIAATGRGENRTFPWGETPDPDCAHVIFDPDGGRCGYPVVVGTASAGSSRDGVFDMTGSLQEWVWDAVSNNAPFPANPGQNYAGPPWPDGGVLPADVDHGDLGGDWTQSTFYGVQATVQTGGGAGGVPWDNVGFRCARSF